MVTEWKLKSRPPDFVVREVIHDATEESWKEKMARIRGSKSHPRENNDTKKYLWMTMRKEDADFFSSIGAVARALSISTKDVGYSGTKDRRAITYQTISIPYEKEEEARVMKIPGLSFSDYRLRARPIKLGEHEGNSFEITVRNVGKSERAKAEGRLKSIRKYGFVNFFGQQRFGSVSGRNAEIGKILILGNIKGAAEALTSGKLARGTPEHAMRAYLSERRGDFRGALRLCPLRMLKLFVHAYQALLWNEAADAYSRASKGKTQDAIVPVVGYTTDLRNYPKVRRIVEGILEREKIDAGDFRNKEYKELSSRGSERNLLCVPRDLSWSLEDDDENPGTLKITLSFFLKKGSYATELVRQVESLASSHNMRARK